MSETVEQLTARALPLAEYESVRGGGAGLFDLSERGRIEVSGAEAVQFLNGLITNDVKALAPGTWMTAAFPNVQGRLLALARVVRSTDAQTFLFDTEAATRERVQQNLARFTLAGDFRVQDITAETALLSLQGAQSAVIIERVLGIAATQVERMRLQPDDRGVRVHAARVDDGTDAKLRVDAGLLQDHDLHLAGDESARLTRTDSRELDPRGPTIETLCHEAYDTEFH